VNDPPGRYRVSLTLDNTHIADGWWNSRATAEKKFTSWVGEQGRDGARIELIDTKTNEVLKAWP
jgi:hypothetical protein